VSDRVTIKSIAQDLGISHMTVSRALSDSAIVSEDTRRAVQDRAKELGYVKNAAARAMRGEKTTIVGLLLPTLVNEFYARFANSLAEYCEDAGLQLIIHLTNDDAKKEHQSILKLREIQARAVVMVPAPGDLKEEEKHLRGLHVIQLIRTQGLKRQYTALLVDDAGAISEAVRHLSDLGHSRVAYIGADTSLSSGKCRLSAFISGMRQAGLDPRPDEILTDKPSFIMGHRCATALIDSGRTTAIVCGGFEISNGALHACLEREMAIPDDISFIGYGDPSYYRWIGEGISTIKIPVDSMAAQTAHLLGRKCPNESEIVSQQILQAKLVIRRSSGSLKNKGGT